MAGMCPRCDARQSSGARWFSLAYLPGLDGLRSVATLRALISRHWGEYHRFVKGTTLKPDEKVLARTEIPGFRIFAVDYSQPVSGTIACFITDERIMMCRSGNRPVQFPLTQVRAVNMYRTFDPPEGWLYGVAIHRIGSVAHEPQGDLFLLCKNQEQSKQLTEVLEARIQRVQHS